MTDWPSHSPREPWGASPAPDLRPPAPPRSRRLHLALLLATVLTTVVSGALLQGINLWETPGQIYRGIPFSFTLLLILGTHEMGHYLASRRHQLDVTLPYFLPAPPFPFIIGTFGAFIRIRSPIRDKRALMDVGCAGPLIGVAVALPVLAVGLSLSKVTQGTAADGASLILGEPLLFRFMSLLVLGPLAPDQNIVMHPVAFAGWVGLLVTALNLLPVGQLDGGHVAYALFPAHHRYISAGCLALLVVTGLTLWYGWLVWVGLLAFLGLRHPPPYMDWVPLDRKRKILGALAILVFLLSFTPQPFDLG